jgi:hypothetical protein
MYPGFNKDILKFNEMYKLEPIDPSTYEALDQLDVFQDILGEELDEADEIIAEFCRMHEAGWEVGIDEHLGPADTLELRTQVADWLGDIVVYCCTQAARWRIPMAVVLRCIMESNFTKLDAQGKPVYDARGKVMKSKLFAPPEPAIRAALAQFDALGGGAHD